LLALIPIAFIADVHTSSIWQQHLLGLGAWLILIVATRFSLPSERTQVWIMVAVSTCVELWSSVVWGIYRYRYHNVPMFVPPGHGLVYLFALRAARTPLFLNYGRQAKYLALSAATLWMVFGLTLEPLLAAPTDASQATSPPGRPAPGPGRPRPARSSGARQPLALRQAVAAGRERLTPVRYDCLGCEVCYPAVALNALNRTEGYATEGAACASEAVQEREGWPPLPGDYTVLRYRAPVAICTLTDIDLATALTGRQPEGIAIVGSLQTDLHPGDVVICDGDDDWSSTLLREYLGEEVEV